MREANANYINRNNIHQKQYTPMETVGQSWNTQTGTMLKRIGSTNYRVRVHFSDTNRETIDEKISRMIQQEVGR